MFDVCIVGCGVVGAALAREFALQNLKTLILEKNSSPFSGASGGNSGIFHTGFDSKFGTLEGELVRSGWKNFHLLQQASKIPIQTKGALVVAWNEEELSKLSQILQTAYQNGVTDAKLISAEDLFYLEPNLSRIAKGAVFVPQESIVDPFLIPLIYLSQALARGAKLETLCELQHATFQSSQSCWFLETSKGAYQAKLVFNVSGNYGDLVEKLVRKPPFRIIPRKGEFVVYRPSSPLTQHIILPVPTERTKGVILFPSLYGEYLVGPTAVDQLDRTFSTTSEETKQLLMKKGEYMLPVLAQHSVIGIYSGLRPATQFQDYQIDFLKEQHWISVSGIRSTGLSAALGISEYVLNQTKRLWPSLSYSPVSQSEVFKEASNIVQELLHYYTNLTAYFRGYTFHVAHPLPRLRGTHIDGATSKSSSKL